MPSSPITSWQIDGERVETVAGFICLGSKITTDGDCSHEIKRRLLLGKKVMTYLDSILKSRDITLSTKVRLVKATGEGNGNPLQYSCLENPMDWEAWWATVHGVAELDTPEWLHFLSSFITGLPKKPRAEGPHLSAPSPSESTNQCLVTAVMSDSVWPHRL